MKRLFFLILLICVLNNTLAAQDSATSSQKRTSLLEALQTIEQSQSEYTIDIVSDGLEGLTTTSKFDGLDAVSAVKRVCKGLPVKVKVHGKRIYVQHEREKKTRKLKLNGEVQDIRAHKPLIGAHVELLDADSTVLQQTVASHHWTGYSEDGKKHEWDASDFSFTVPALPARYIFRISYLGHRTAYVDYKLERIGRREYERALPPFYLTQQSTMLDEVVVTASKVKFYYKGDTIIYNADAFVLAEGSLLDALIVQLPGVELKSDGRIYHNGKFVDDLLLNGKEFFSKDRKVMLENLPAYTVKDIAIYDKQTAENEWLGIKDERTQHHVIDVRLKREYMVGWIVNMEMGGGLKENNQFAATEESTFDFQLSTIPYLARLFAMRHSDVSRFAVVANANNLDDETKPRDNDSWQRGNTNDLRRTERADIDFSASDREKRWEYHGDISVNHQRTEGETRIVHQNYLPTGDTYDHSFSSRRNEDLHITTYQDFYRNHQYVRWHISPNVKYHRFNHSSDLSSATFNAPVVSVSRQLLDDLYSPASSRINLRDTLVNRILRQGVGSGHSLEGTFGGGATIKIPNTNENLRLGADITYSNRDERLFDRQTVNIGSEAQPASHQHQFYDNHPTRDLDANLMVGYNLPLGPGWRSLFTYYMFDHRWQDHRSTLYLLDRLAGEGAGERSIDELPSVSEYQQVMDRSNSFDSRFRENSHKLIINLGYKWDKKTYGQFWTLLNCDINLRQQHLDYERGRIDTTLYRTACTVNMDNNTYLDLEGGHQIGFSAGLHETLPNLEQRINLRDDTDPMNVRLGNTGLRTAITPDVGLRGTYRMKQGFHYLEWNYRHTFNAIAMGYVYDPRTGVRTYRPENVNGNWNTDVSYTFHRDFGEAKKMNLDIPFKTTYRQSVDLVGVTTEADMQAGLSVVHHLTLSLSPTFKVDIGKQHFDLTCQPMWDRYTSDRTDFQEFHAFTSRTSLAAILKFPWSLDLNTDLSLYTRTGYADTTLNTNDLVWNARLTRPFLKGRLLLMFDGFDILGQLSNVTRTVNAQGRTETYTNVMPRYALVHVVYRINKQPMKR